jgi:acyl-CoA reductase-like NAD-dependent aldehyde dehydrogenase
MTEPVTQPEEQKPETVTSPEEKKFTQADLDRIISERLEREKTKRTEAEKAAVEKATAEALAKNQEWEKLAKQRQEELDKKTAELAERDLREKKRKIAIDTGLPEALAVRLVGTTDEELAADAKALLETIPKKTTSSGGQTNPGGGGAGITETDTQRLRRMGLG